ncbi:tRNA (adenosine(37)-N6)-threonylcarbamoyltransferase complex dimerization subunit type 1 TsaB [Phaeobacter sp. 11ANDIMAR09]|uniref:tRNA (adenosine(37)-N6)-threonylcarbamoyltransferase complex dimerization subunit type 1 TsaB n=1 Tax=Phaeobacter sp. 11ANDIMAR09 TaxID=1225647 RepID=UPI0006C8656F|nr:tRNA (adenosine(37)-N6)-threonylcarbamoyltransferase complex dimerization subunit type 1 TsaB [Phaeobacter sp. 11ANDIMAR09]KPD13578.1 peptidase M22 [Phaeobacter sp. 11ANDIMAR09]OIQ35109.1 MAG: tRNA (adenosine(37)-N6)-threonylcarbamoyltransferase complex dimerization subunit type 1 TsaB [Roseobacter sp. MedPE-SWchi]
MVQRADPPLVLGFDTSAPHCTAALLRGDQILAQSFEAHTRGQAERLMPMLQEVLAEAGQTWSALTAIGVGIGPGNFTGIRIAVSAARGLALGLKIPAVGVDGFDAREQQGHLAAIPAPRAQVYCRLLGQAPRLMPESEASDAARSAGLVFAPEASPATLAQRIAELAATRYPTCTTSPAPLYLRAADAAPARDLPPQLIDG